MPSLHSHRQPRATFLLRALVLVAGLSVTQLSYADCVNECKEKNWRQVQECLTIVLSRGLEESCRNTCATDEACQWWFSNIDYCNSKELKWPWTVFKCEERRARCFTTISKNLKAKVVEKERDLSCWRDYQ